MFSDALHNNQNCLSTHYGALVGLCELGPEVIKAFIMPHIKSEGEKVRHLIEGMTNQADKIAGDHIKQAFMVSILPCKSTNLLF